MVIPAEEQTPNVKSEEINEPAPAATRSSGRKRKSIDAATPSRSSSRHVYLVNKTLESFAFKKLPSNEEVLQRLLNIITFNPQKTLSYCIKQTVQELLDLWEASSIPTVDAKKVTETISALYKDWLKLKNDYESLNVDLNRVENAGLQADLKQLKEQEIKVRSSFGDLFDISHPDIDQMAINEEDLKFLNLQRSKSRTGYISTRIDQLDDDEMEADA